MSGEQIHSLSPEEAHIAGDRNEKDLKRKAPRLSVVALLDDLQLAVMVLFFGLVGLVGTRSLLSICLNHSDYPLRCCHAYPAYWRFAPLNTWLGEWVGQPLFPTVGSYLPQKWLIYLLYYLQLGAPVLVLVWFTQQILHLDDRRADRMVDVESSLGIRSQDGTANPKKLRTSKRRIFFFSVSLCCLMALQSFAAIEVLDVGWLRTGETVARWLFEGLACLAVYLILFAT